VTDPVAEAKIQEFMKNPEHSKMQPGDQFTLACVSFLSFIIMSITKGIKTFKQIF
jgi:hypothetical protein